MPMSRKTEQDKRRDVHGGHRYSDLPDFERPDSLDDPRRLAWSSRSMPCPFRWSPQPFSLPSLPKSAANGLKELSSDESEEDAAHR